MNDNENDNDNDNENENWKEIEQHQLLAVSRQRAALLIGIMGIVGTMGIVGSRYNVLAVFGITNLFNGCVLSCKIVKMLKIVDMWRC